MSRDNLRLSSTSQSMVRLRSRGMRAQVFPEERLAAEHHQVRRQVAFLRALVTERIGFRVRLEKEIERVEYRHLGDEVHLDAQLPGLLREHEAREVVSLRILLPVDEVVVRRDLQRVRQDARAAVRRGAQAHDLGAEAHEAIVAVVRDVIERDMDGHGCILHSALTCAFAPNCASGGPKAPSGSGPGQAPHFFERLSTALVFLGRASRNK